MSNVIGELIPEDAVIIQKFMKDLTDYFFTEPYDGPGDAGRGDEIAYSLDGLSEKGFAVLAIMVAAIRASIMQSVVRVEAKKQEGVL